MGDMYLELAREFDEKLGLTERDVTRAEEMRDRFDIVDEEVDELFHEVQRYHDIDAHPHVTREELEPRVAEELADVLVTCFSMADLLDIDIAGAYAEKMQYNLAKSGRIEDGKVQDDTDVEKPDFEQFTPTKSERAAEVEAILDDYDTDYCRVEEAYHGKVIVDLPRGTKLPAPIYNVLRDAGYYQSGLLTETRQDDADVTRLWFRDEDCNDE